NEHKRVTEIRERLASFRDEANKILAARKQPGVVIDPALAGQMKQDTPERDLERAEAKAREFVDDLKKLLLPRFFKGAWPLVPFVIFWAVLAGVLLALEINLGDFHWALVSGAGALVLEIIVVGLLYMMARSKVRDYRRAICKVLARGEVACQRIYA